MTVVTPPATLVYKQPSLTLILQMYFCLEVNSLISPLPQQTWRQLWRVLEISDIVLLITDVRHPTLHFSPALYNHVVNDLGKKLVLVLNKVSSWNKLVLESLSSFPPVSR